ALHRRLPYVKCEVKVLEGCRAQLLEEVERVAERSDNLLPVGVEKDQAHRRFEERLAPFLFPDLPFRHIVLNGFRKVGTEFIDFHKGGNLLKESTVSMMVSVAVGASLINRRENGIKILRHLMRLRMVPKSRWPLEGDLLDFNGGGGRRSDGLPLVLVLQVLKRLEHQNKPGLVLGPFARTRRFLLLDNCQDHHFQLFRGSLLNCRPPHTRPRIIVGLFRRRRVNRLSTALSFLGLGSIILINSTGYPIVTVREFARGRLDVDKLGFPFGDIRREIFNKCHAKATTQAMGVLYEPIAITVKKNSGEKYQSFILEIIMNATMMRIAIEKNWFIGTPYMSLIDIRSGWMGNRKPNIIWSTKKVKYLDGGYLLFPGESPTKPQLSRLSTRTAARPRPFQPVHACIKLLFELTSPDRDHLRTRPAAPPPTSFFRRFRTSSHTAAARRPYAPLQLIHATSSGSTSGHPWANSPQRLHACLRACTRGPQQQTDPPVALHDSAAPFLDPSSDQKHFQSGFSTFISDLQPMPLFPTRFGFFDS
ncbi:Unknown protein, partial [Striga hermonthica]